MRVSRRRSHGPGAAQAVVLSQGPSMGFATAFAGGQVRPELPERGEVRIGWFASFAARGLELLGFKSSRTCSFRVGYLRT